MSGAYDVLSSWWHQTVPCKDRKKCKGTNHQTGIRCLELSPSSQTEPLPLFTPSHKQDKTVNCFSWHQKEILKNLCDRSLDKSTCYLTTWVGSLGPDGFYSWKLISDLHMFAIVLWNNPSVHCEYALLSLVNKEADWPIARQDKVRWDNQTEDTGMKNGGVRGDAS